MNINLKLSEYCYSGNYQISHCHFRLLKTILMLELSKKIKLKFDFYQSGGYFCQHITVIETGVTYDKIPL